jgi:hypothetical protein
MCLPVSRLFWVSSLAYPNLLGTKGYVVVVVVVVVDIQEIKKIRLPSEPAEVISAWHYENNGFYTVKSAYLCLARKRHMGEHGGGQSTSANLEGRPIWKEYWKILLPHKILIFGWKIMNNGLATQQNKFQRSMGWEQSR